MNKTLMRIFLALFLVGLVIAYFYFDLRQYLNLQYIKSEMNNFNQFYLQNPLTTMSIYLGVYILMSALSLPGAAILTLLGGALFGVFYGTVLVSFASTIGATFAFLSSRLIFKDWVQDKFKKQLKSINSGIEREGAFYLFSIRLIPLFPFFVVNLVMGLTPIKVWTFFWVSQVGMLAGTIVYVNAGTQLAQIESLKGILSPAIILSFVALGLFPIIAKKLLAFIKSKKRES